MKRLVRLSRTATLLLCLTLFGLSVSGCWHRADVIILPDSEVITTLPEQCINDPDDEGKVCMDSGYLYRIYEDCGVEPE